MVDSSATSPIISHSPDQIPPRSTPPPATSQTTPQTGGLTAFTIKSIPAKHRKPKHSLPSLREMVTAFLVCLVTHISLRYVASQLTSTTSTKTASKWLPRDILLPKLPVFIDISNGDLVLLDSIILQHDMSVVVFYAPWSRASHRVLENLSELSPVMVGIKFIAINCWLYHTVCRDSYNHWEYPQILIYHKAVDHIPYIFGLSTHPPSLEVYLNRFLHPVWFVEDMAALSGILLSHQRSVIGIFSNVQSLDYQEFRKAAVMHHFEYVDGAYFVPFLVANGDLTNILNDEDFNFFVFKHVMFEPLTRYETRSRPLRHSELLRWLNDWEQPIEYLSHHKFPTLLAYNVSVILNSPLYRNSENVVAFTQAVMSYRNCPSEIRMKIHCEPNRTCLDPCQPHTALTKESILPCFSTHRPPPQFIQQCVYNTQKPLKHDFTRPVATPISPTFGASPLSDEPIPTRTFLESEVMCSESEILQDMKLCNTFQKIEHFHTDLDLAIYQASRPFVYPFHGVGCTDSSTGFYSLDSVIWYDLASRFGLNDTSRKTEAIIKIQSHSLHRFDLTNKSLESDLGFARFVWGDDLENEDLLQDRSGKYHKQKSVFIEDMDKKTLIRLLEKTSESVFIVIYSSWCGYCQILWKKLESVVRLSQNDDLRFVSVNTDHNDLRGTILEADNLPTVFLKSPEDDVMNVFIRLNPQKPVSVKDIIRFIRQHLPGSMFSNKFGGSFPDPVPLPCKAWDPFPAPVYKYKTDENLGLSDSSFLDLFKDVIPPERDITFSLNVDTKFKSTKTDTEKNAGSSKDYCWSSRYLFLSFSKTTLFGNGLPLAVLITIINDLYEFQCLSNTPAFWDSLADSCALRISEETDFSCVNLESVYFIYNHYAVAMPEITELLLGVASRDLNVVSRDLNVAQSARLDSIASCYNVDYELLYYLRGKCSVTCPFVCRVVNKLHLHF